MTAIQNRLDPIIRADDLKVVQNRLSNARENRDIYLALTVVSIVSVIFVFLSPIFVYLANANHNLTIKYSRVVKRQADVLHKRQLILRKQLNREFIQKTQGIRQLQQLGINPQIKDPLLAIEEKVKSFRIDHTAEAPPPKTINESLHTISSDIDRKLCIFVKTKDETHEAITREFSRKESVGEILRNLPGLNGPHFTIMDFHDTDHGEQIAEDLHAFLKENKLSTVQIERILNKLHQGLILEITTKYFQSGLFAILHEFDNRTKFYNLDYDGKIQIQLDLTGTSPVIFAHINLILTEGYEKANRSVVARTRNTIEYDVQSNIYTTRSQNI